MHSGHLPLMISSLNFNSREDFTIFRDQVFYSHDALFVFFFIVNAAGYIEKAIVANSNNLTVPDTHEITLAHLNIKALNLESEPALLWGHKDSFEMDYADRGTYQRLASDFSQAARKYVLYLQHSGKALFVRDSDILMQFDLEQKMPDDQGIHHDFKVLRVLFEQQPCQPTSLETFDSINKEERQRSRTVYKYKDLKDSQQKQITLIALRSRVNSLYANQRIFIYKTSLLRLQDKADMMRENHLQLEESDFFFQ